MSIVVLTYSFFLIASVIFFISLRYKKRRESKAFAIDKTQNVDASVVTFIVPFRNEEKHLPKLIASFQAQSMFPFNIIFVDDHSTEDSCQLITSFKEKYDFVQLFHLPNDVYGKKQAIRFAVSHVSTPFFLTLDADVTFSPDFIASLRFNSNVAMIAYPVEMKGVSVVGRFAAFEYNFFNAFNDLLASTAVVTISGANLLIKKDAFLQYDSIQEHKHILSGDDYFLLRDFKQHTALISVVNNHSNKVVTASPEQINAYFSQRLRWLSKTRFNPSKNEILLGLFFLIYFIMHGFVLTYCLYTQQFILLLCFLFIRLGLDYRIYRSFAKKLQLKISFTLLLSLQFIYPIIFFSVALLSFFSTPSWKGRPTG